MNIGNRLKLVASMITPGSRVADIGSDHAYLPIYLARNKISPMVIATEVRRGPYERAKENVVKSGLEGVIELRFGSGFNPIAPGDTDIATISGMGGLTIVDIVKDNLEVADSFEYLILQPMRNQSFLRRELFLMSYAIIEEDVAIEGNKYYEVLAVKKQAGIVYDEIDVIIGPILRRKKTPNVIEYLNWRTKNLMQVIKKLELADTEHSRVALSESLKELEILREVAI